MASNNNKRILYAVLREDFVSFAQKVFPIYDGSEKFVLNDMFKILADYAQRIYNDDELKRLIVNLPPRSGKSFLFSVALPAFILGKKPSAQILCISQTQDLAKVFSAACIKIMQSDIYKKLFPNTVLEKSTEIDLRTTKGGLRHAASVGSGITGFGAKYIIIDDPIDASNITSGKKRENVNDWYNDTILSRLNNKITGKIIIVMQRLHEKDLTSHLIKQNCWEHLVLPAIAVKDECFTLSTGETITRKAGDVLNPEREPLDVLNVIKSSVNNFVFAAQYQQCPVPEKGNIIDFDKFQYCDFPYEQIRDKNCISVQSWDIALKSGERNDYTVGINAIIHNKIIYITDIFRKKVNIENLEEEIINYNKSHHCQNLIIEESAGSQLLINKLKELNIWNSIIPYRPTESKIERADNIYFNIVNGNVKLLRGAYWLEDFKEEINSFPNGLHDDMVDALTQLVLSLEDIIPKVNMADVVKELTKIRKSEANEHGPEFRFWYRRNYGT